MAVLIRKIGGIREALGRKRKQYERFPDVRIVFSAPQARKIHESVEMKWRGRLRPVKLGGVYWGPSGEAKFLEKAARQADKNGQFRRIVQRTLKGGGTLRKAAINASLYVLYEARVRVPVITGKLRDSGVVRTGSQVYR